MSNYDDFQMYSVLTKLIDTKESIIVAEKELKNLQSLTYRFKFYIENEDTHDFKICFNPDIDEVYGAIFNTSSIIIVDNSKSTVGGDNGNHILNTFMSNKENVIRCIEEVLDIINNRLSFEDKKIITYTYIFPLKNLALYKKLNYVIADSSDKKNYQKVKYTYLKNLDQALTNFAWCSNIYKVNI